jgi:parvulin-like peptidyl-prolyl isomerase
MRRKLTLLLFVPIALLAVVAAGCGGGGSSSSGDVSSDAVAQVGNQKITKDQFNQLLDQAKRSYATQHKAFPKEGTSQYEQLKSQAMQFLVQRAEFQQKGDDLGIKISDGQIDARLKQIKQQYFKGNDAKYKAQLKKQGLTEQQVKDDIKAQLLSEAIYKNVTKGVTVSDSDIRKYYDQHKSQYQTGESRKVRHILIACGSQSSTSTTGSTKKPKSCSEAKSEAQKLYNELKNGASFATLAKKNSDDPGSASQGGTYTATKGTTVPEYDQAAFSLPKGKLSQPFQTKLGYFILQPLSDVQPKKVTPFSQVKESIRQQLLQQQKNQVMTKWVTDTKKSFDVSYQVGYAPSTTNQ